MDARIVAHTAHRGNLFDGFIQRNPEEVIHEIESAVMKYGISDIALYDDAFLVNAREHALPILEAVAQRLPGLRWHTPNGSARGRDNTGSSRGHEKSRI